METKFALIVELVEQVGLKVARCNVTLTGIVLAGGGVGSRAGSSRGRHQSELKAICWIRFLMRSLLLLPFMLRCRLSDL